MPLTPSHGAAVFLCDLVDYALHGELSLAGHLCFESLELVLDVFLAKSPH